LVLRPVGCLLSAVSSLLSAVSRPVRQGGCLLGVAVAPSLLRRGGCMLGVARSLVGRLGLVNDRLFARLNGLLT
jgi:hypothetical protein